MRLVLELLLFVIGFIVSCVMLVYCCLHTNIELYDLAIPLTLGSMCGVLVCGDKCHACWARFDRDRRFP